MSPLQTQKTSKSRKKNSAALRELTAAAAHEINNCLTGIRGCLQVLEQDLPGGAPQKGIAGEILSDVGRLDIILKTLLLFTLSPEPNPMPVRVNAVIQKVKATLEAQLRWPHLDIRFAPQSVPDILIDPEQLRLALLNMALRRIQAMGGEGNIIFAAREKRCSGEVEISLTDKATVEGGNRIDPSVPSGETCARLGLAVGKIIIESNKGRIDVKNSKGAGTVVRIMLKTMERE